MSENDLWKYCTPRQVREMLQSFDLLQGVKIKEEKYFSCLYAVSNHTEQHYQSIVIPKKEGGVRKLLAPDYLLGRIQKNILHHVLAELPVSVYARAYKPQTSIVENARPHVGAGQILKLDMKGFFDHISYFLVYRYAFPAVYYPPAVRTILANLCCCRDVLPQGAPTSPAVSNLVMKPFDEYMGNWCEERQIQYTRYCDDMTFSGKFDIREVKNKVRGFLAAYGFELNEKKTRVRKSHQRQMVTGIIVNEKPQVSRAYRRKLRSEVYYCGKYGVRSHLQRVFSPIDDSICRQYLQSLLGKINYVLQVNPGDTEFQQARLVIQEIQSNIELRSFRERGNRYHESNKIIENADGMETV